MNFMDQNSSKLLSSPSREIIKHDKSLLSQVDFVVNVTFKFASNKIYLPLITIKVLVLSR